MPLPQSCQSQPIECRSFVRCRKSLQRISSAALQSTSNTTSTSSHSTSKSDSLTRLYEMDGDPERRPFLDKLLHFMQERDTPIAQCPTISKNPLDLYRLYLFTKEKGGFMEVCMPCLEPFILHTFDG